MRSEDYDDEHNKRGWFSGDSSEPNEEDSKYINLFHKIAKYAILFFAVYVSVVIIMGSKSVLLSSLFVGAFWVAGYFLYKKRKNLDEWSHAHLSTELEHRSSIVKPREKAVPKARLTTLDEEASQPLNNDEKSSWDSIVNTFHKESFDVLKPFEKKKNKKDK
jgi:hypothetical protein